jgi:hypothetical protein
LGEIPQHAAACCEDRNFEDFAFISGQPTVKEISTIFSPFPKISSLWLVVSVDQHLRKSPKVVGRLRPTGVLRPKAIAQIEACGIPLRPLIFNPDGKGDSFHYSP